MAGLLTKAVDFWVRIRQGEPESALEHALSEALAAAPWPRDISRLLISPPNLRQLINEGQRLYSAERDYLARNQHEDASIRSAREFQLQQREIFLASQQPEENLPPVERELSRKANRLRQKIEQVLIHSSDSRAKVVIAAMNNPKDLYFIAQAAGSANAEGMNILLEEVLTNNDAAEVLGEEFQEVDSDSETTLMHAQNLLKLQTPADTYSQSLRWYQPMVSVPGELDMQLHSRGSAATMVLGFAQRFWSESNEVQRCLLALQLERVTGMSSAMLTRINRADASSFARGIKRVCEEAGFGSLFDSETTLESGMHASTNRDYYRNGMIRLTWDAETNGRTILHASAYMVDGVTGAQLTFSTDLTGLVENRFYADIPVAKFEKLSFRSYALKVVVWFDEKEADGVKNQRVTATTNAFTVEFDSANAVPNNGDDLESLPAANATLINYLRTEILPGLGEVSETEWASPTEGDGGQCKTWVQGVIISAFETQGLSLNIPMNDPNDLSKWFEGGDVVLVNDISIQSLSESNKEEIIKDFFQNVISGDMLQIGLTSESGDLRHTLIVDSVDEHGIWVFDSNWSSDFDQTVRYHYLSFESFVNDIGITIYRINP
jgi:hypothetical protein